MAEQSQLKTYNTSNMSIPPLKNSANRQIARAAGTIMVAMILSQVASLAAKILIAHAFGTGMESDAFFAANRFSEILFNLVAGGALGSAFIPTLTTLLSQDDRSGAWRLASALANWVTLILTVLAILSAVFADQVVRYILAPAFSATSPEKEILTVQLLRLQLPSAVIFGLSGLVMGILNAHQNFLFPALAPAMYSFGLIIGAVVLAPAFGGIYGLAAGVVLGAALHLGLQLPGLLSLPALRYRFTLGLHVPEVSEVARLMAPRLLGVAITQLNFLVNTNLASAMSQGSLTGISLAFPLMYMPLAAIAQSVAVAALPTFSDQAARGQLDEMRASLAVSLRGVLLLAVPASLGLMVLRKPLVALLYQHGDLFTAESTELVAWALLFYAFGLVAFSIVEIVSRAFYALHDTRTPVVVGVIAMSLNLVFSLLFSDLFRRIGWAPHGGLALANSVATYLEAFALLYLMRRRLGGLHGRSILAGFGQAGAAALVMGAVLAGWLLLAGSEHFAISALGGVAAGGAVYGLVLLALGVSEVHQVIGLVQKRVFKR
ncbi:MAG TPA: murein biosynthesis integral membrane protein MurJ [Anaerolineaceae bacterium]